MLQFFLAMVRVLAELAGAAFALYVGFMLFMVVSMGSPAGLLWLSAGYVLCIPAWFALRRANRPVRWRLVFDAAILAVLPAAFLTTWAVSERWPLRGKRVDAHGWGRSGGEANGFFFSWLHALIWIGLIGALAWWDLRSRNHVVLSSRPDR